VTVALACAYVAQISRRKRREGVYSRPSVQLRYVSHTSPTANRHSSGQSKTLTKQSIPKLTAN